MFAFYVLVAILLSVVFLRLQHAWLRQSKCSIMPSATVVPLRMPAVTSLSPGACVEHGSACILCTSFALQDLLTTLPVLVQETNQEVPGWLQGMGARAHSFGGGKRRGGGNRFGGQDFRRDNGSHCKSTGPMAGDMLCSAGAWEASNVLVLCYGLQLMWAASLGVPSTALIGIVLPIASGLKIADTCNGRCSVARTSLQDVGVMPS